MRAISLLKHEHGKWFARQLAGVVKGEGQRVATDVIVPVPLPAQRARKRGFHPVDVFGTPLIKMLGLPYIDRSFWCDPALALKRIYFAT